MVVGFGCPPGFPPTGDGLVGTPGPLVPGEDGAPVVTYVWLTNWGTVLSAVLEGAVPCCCAWVAAFFPA